MEAATIAEIGDPERRDAEPPEVAGKLVEWRDTSLGEVPVPLGPERFLVFGQVERVDDDAALPAVVRGRLWPTTGIDTVRDVAQPFPGGIDCVGRERQPRDLRRRLETRARR